MSEIIEYGAPLRERLLRAMQAGHKMPLRECSICDAALHYFVHDDQLYYQSACNCTATAYRTPAQPRDVADLDIYTHEDNGTARDLAAWATSKGF